MLVGDLSTPALVVDAAALEHNLATMATALPGARMRPHVKAHKCTELARRQLEHGHRTFTCATPRELIGLANAGLREDLLLANESVDDARLRAMAQLDARVTVAVDSEATVNAAARAGLREVLVDVDVGMPRCGCAPDAAGRIADHARAAGLEVRGVMGYEGHVVGLADRAARREQTEESMAKLLAAHALTGGDVVSGGGTGTFDINTWVNEIQAGSYALMDSAYGALDLPFQRAVHIVATVVSVREDRAVADCGLKALGMDHGNPSIDGAVVWFCSDEHITFSSDSDREAAQTVSVGERVVVWPSHVDPTVAYHERMHVATGASADAEVLESWPVDLRGW
jgi:D-serine deaminase-like pyridoxal phosphate-dependent protein